MFLTFNVDDDDDDTLKPDYLMNTPILFFLKG